MPRSRNCISKTVKYWKFFGLTGSHILLGSQDCQLYSLDITNLVVLSQCENSNIYQCIKFATIHSPVFTICILRVELSEPDTKLETTSRPLCTKVRTDCRQLTLSVSVDDS
jgi:hypothetical protein